MTKFKNLLRPNCDVMMDAADKNSLWKTAFYCTVYDYKNHNNFKISYFLKHSEIILKFFAVSVMAPLKYARGVDSDTPG